MSTDSGLTLADKLGLLDKTKAEVAVHKSSMDRLCQIVKYHTKEIGNIYNSVYPT